MRMWIGTGVFQWENSRGWSLNNASEFCRLDGALVLPGFSSLSIFFRQKSQTAGGTWTLNLWTAPLYTKLLDDDITTALSTQLLYGPLAMEPATGLNLSIGGATGAKVFGAKIGNSQPMGSVLFWEMNQSVAALHSLTGDIYVVPTFTGSTSQAQIARTVDVQMQGGQASGANPGQTRAR